MQIPNAALLPIRLTAWQNWRAWPGDGACPFPFDPEELPIEHPALWSPMVAPSVVILRAPCPETSDVKHRIARRSASILAEAEASDGRHLVLTGGRRRHRLWIRQGASSSAEAFETSPDKSDLLRVGATLQFNRWLHGTGPQLLRPLLVPTPYQRRRLIQLLRIADGQADGATLREIAYAVVVPHHSRLAASEWKASSERRVCHRLLAAANRLIAGDYVKLLTA